MLPLVTGGERESSPMPAIVVNPTMEMVMIAQHEGRWHPQFTRLSLRSACARPARNC
jgi:hypothetical protein